MFENKNKWVLERQALMELLIHGSVMKILENLYVQIFLRKIN
jgi:hypothetical protein